METNVLALSRNPFQNVQFSNPITNVVAKIKEPIATINKIDNAISFTAKKADNDSFPKIDIDEESVPTSIELFHKRGLFTTTYAGKFKNNALIMETMGNKYAGYCGDNEFHITLSTMYGAELIGSSNGHSVMTKAWQGDKPGVYILNSSGSARQSINITCYTKNAESNNRGFYGNMFGKKISASVEGTLKSGMTIKGLINEKPFKLKIDKEKIAGGGSIDTTVFPFIFAIADKLDKISCYEPPEGDYIPEDPLKGVLSF